MAEEPEVLTTTQARSGIGMTRVRYVLIASVALAVIAMVWSYLGAPRASQQGANTLPAPAAIPAPAAGPVVAPTTSTTS